MHMHRQFEDIVVRNKLAEWEEERKRNQELIQQYNTMRDQLAQGIDNLSKRNNELELLIKQLAAKAGK